MGFSEAESNFYISTKGHLTFKIKLHIDDLATLIFNQEMLSKFCNRKVGVLRVLKTENACRLEISSLRDIIEVVIPAHPKYPKLSQIPQIPQIVPNIPNWEPLKKFFVVYTKFLTDHLKIFLYKKGKDPKG